jgi:glycosyltransferase involved in cell wall biosynthesis
MRKIEAGKKKVLFISHEATRTGAPIIFLNFLKWFRNNSDISFRILLKNSGELEADFRAIGPVSIFNKNFFSTNRLQVAEIFFQRINRYLNQIRLWKLKKQLKSDRISVIYSNTSTNGDILEFLSFLNCPVITHVHELEYNIRFGIGMKNFDLVKKFSDKYIAVSQAVKSNLLQNHGIPQDKIDLVYGFIPIQLENNKSYISKVKLRIKEEHNIEKDAMIVGACGINDWRKGADLFIQLARAIRERKHETPVHFVWIGGAIMGARYNKLMYVAKILGIEKVIHFVGVKSDPLNYFSAFDVFTLVSREDPYPLVCLEAASVGTPIVCFDHSGGMKEFVEDDCGFVVPFLDIETMADKVSLLLKSEKLRDNLGKRAAQKVYKRHDIKMTAPKIHKIIERFL